MKQYELIIIGSGPAGLAASIYASRAEIKTLVIEKSPMSGGQIINTYEVDNYPGIPEISGFDLAMKFRSHSDSLGTEFVEGDVIRFRIEDKLKYVTLDNGTTYESKAVIIATGAKNRHLDVYGEQRLLGRGVSYCATCDGAFFKNKTVAVIGGGDAAAEDGIFLSRLCRKVYIIHRREALRAAKSLCTQLEQKTNVEFIWNSQVIEIRGNDQVDTVQIEDTISLEHKLLSVDGVFIAIGTVPQSELYRDIVKVDGEGYIIAGEDCKTNIPGVFAAGDIRTKQLKQVITAAADGANAITSVEHYLINV